jgi:hypothetical protein
VRRSRCEGRRIKAALKMGRLVSIKQYGRPYRRAL